MLSDYGKIDIGYMDMDCFKNFIYMDFKGIDDFTEYYLGDKNMIETNMTCPICKNKFKTKIVIRGKLYVFCPKCKNGINVYDEIVMMKDGRFITFRYLRENGSEKIFEAELLK